MINIHTKKNSGFTLIEMLIAVFIFSLSLAALMAVSSKGLRSANQAQKQVIGDYLALEGIEVVRNLRDSALLSFEDSSTWQNVFDQDNCLSQSGGPAAGCSFTLGSGITLEPCTTCTVYYSENDYAYRHNALPGYSDSGFTREVQFTLVPGNDSEIIVEVIVAWDTGQVSYSENLFLWL